MHSFLRDISVRGYGGKGTYEFGRREIKGEVLVGPAWFFKSIQKDLCLAKVAVNVSADGFWLLITSVFRVPLPASKLDNHGIGFNELRYLHRPGLKYVQLSVGEIVLHAYGQRDLLQMGMIQGPYFANTSSAKVSASKSFNPISSYSKIEGIIFSLPSHGCRPAIISSRIERVILVERTSRMGKSTSRPSADL